MKKVEIRDFMPNTISKRKLNIKKLATFLEVKMQDVQCKKKKESKAGYWNKSNKHLA